MKHLISTKQFTSSAQVQMLFDGVTPCVPLCEKNAVMATLFYQPSTRTRLSFEAAFCRLGGKVIGFENALEFSSAQKGESLEDTVRTVQEYADIIVLRHPMKGAAHHAVRYCNKSILINAGDGDGEHPTQALLDLYTIQKHRNIEGLHIALVGDLLYSRTVHSLIYLLSLYKNVTVTVCSPTDLRLPSEFQAFLNEDRGEYTVGFRSKINLEQVLYEKPDIIYMTRSQRPGYIYSKEFCLGVREIDILDRLDASTLIMHPLPRQNEIDPAVDDSPRAKYFEQVGNGLHVRKGILNNMMNDFFCWE